MDYTLRLIVVGTGMLGLVSGALGSFALLRKQSLLGDAISHAALPGIALAFLITHTKSPLVFLAGAAAAGWVGTLLILTIIRNTRIKEDGALGIILSVFFGLGLVLLTYIQKMSLANQSGLVTYLFGSAATLLEADLVAMAVLGVAALAVLMLFWKEFKLLVFDWDYAHALGYPVKRLEILLTSLLVIAIVIGLQTVGVVLMSAMIIAPAAAARQWTNRLSVMVILSGCLGATSGIVGAVISSTTAHLPTGPVIVLVMSGFVFVSLLFAPRRGILWAFLASAAYRRNIQEQTMLTNLLLFSESDFDPFHPHDIAALTAIGRGPARRALGNLARHGLVINPNGDAWALTPKGLDVARDIQAQHLAEVRS